MDDKVWDASIPLGAMTETAKCGTRIRRDRHPARWNSSFAQKISASIPHARVAKFLEQWPIEKIAIDMVDFAESLHRRLPSGTAPPHEDENPGLELAKLDRKLTVMLARSGIDRNDPTGLPFDPRCHQKIAERQASSEIPGTILQTLSSTWTLNGRLLRPAMVVVSVAPFDVPFVYSPTDVSAVSCNEVIR